MLPSLKRIELEIIAQRSASLIRALNGAYNPLKEGETTTLDPDDWLLEGIYSALRARGRDFQIIPKSKLTDQECYRHYNQHAPGFRKAIELSIPNMSALEKTLIGEIIADAFVDDCISHEAGNMISILYRSHRMMTVLDGAFPNYLQNGLLAVLLKTRVKNKLRPSPDL